MTKLKETIRKIVKEEVREGMPYGVENEEWSPEHPFMVIVDYNYEGSVVLFYSTEEEALQGTQNGDGRRIYHVSGMKKLADER